MKSIKCRISEVSIKKDDVLLINIEEGKDFSVFDFLDLKNAAKELGQGRKFYNLIIVGEHTLPSKEAREISSSEVGAEFKKADAFIINSLPQKLMANLMMKINIPVVPTKFFTDYNEALKWINQLKKSSEHAT